MGVVSAGVGGTVEESCVDVGSATDRVDLDFATAVDFIYWPFNGEFWKDELGYYSYTEQGSCN